MAKMGSKRQRPIVSDPQWGVFSERNAALINKVIISNPNCLFSFLMFKLNVNVQIKL